MSTKGLHPFFVLSVLGVLLSASQGSGQSGALPYAKTSPWNTPIPANPVVSAQSSSYISGLTGSFGSDPTQYSFPVYRVDSATPLRSVSISGSFKAWSCNTCEATVQSGGTVRAPIPSGAQAAAGTDAQIILWNESTGDEWEFWQLASTTSASTPYTATNGYHYNTKWSAVPASPGPRGAGIPYLAGLVRPWEIALGHIDHALALTYQNTATTYTFPATKTDGPCTLSTCMPEGSRLQLDPTVDVTTLGLSASGAIIAKALQKYGMIVVDTGGHPKLYFEYEGTAHWNGAITDSTVSGIPLDRFRVLDPAHPLGSSGGTAPVVSLSPTSLTFPNQTVGTTSASKVSTLTNSGSTTLTISSVTVSGDFVLAGLGNCGTSLAAGSSCTISVSFTPATTGIRMGMVTVDDSATGSPQTISLTGTGVASAVASALNYYVSTTGSDSSGDGSAANPWATIAHAASVVVPGSTVHVAPGTYTGSFNTDASGTASAYITYISDTKWGAKIAPSGSSTWSNHGNYVAIENFDVSGPPSSCCNAIYTAGNATKIIGNNVHDTQTSNGCQAVGGAGIAVDAPNAYVAGNYVHDNGPFPTPCDYIHGIYIGDSSRSSSGGAAYNNISFDNSGWGIQLWHSATNEILVNNTLFGNLSGGIVVGNDVGADDNTIVNNNLAFNNTRGIWEEGTTGTHNVYQNNLVFQNSSGDWSLQNGNTATATVSADPLFVNWTGDSTGDYHLQPSSPAIGAGTSNGAPTTDYDGNARPQAGRWDIGSYEYVGAPSTASAAVKLSPSALTFADQDVGATSAVQTVTLSNATSAALSITSIAIAGPGGGDFTQTNNCGSSLAAGGACKITVSFTPTASGTRTATLTVTDSAQGSPHTLPLTGTGADFSISLGSGSSTSATVAPGQTATYTLSLKGTPGFTGTVKLACDGAPQAATCTVTPGSVTASGTTPVSVTVSVTTTARSMLPPSMPAPPAANGPVPGSWLFWLLLFSMVASVAARARRRASLGLAVALLSVAFWSSCGGSGNVPLASSGTPAGVYTLTVSAASGKLTHAASLSLKVN